MYGVLRAAGCGLPAIERQAWREHQCGLCLSLRYRFGQAARFATNTDSALVIALYEAQTEEPLPKSSSNCLLRRPFAGLADDPAHPALQYASGTAMLIAANKIRDNLQDDPRWLIGLRSPARWLAEHWHRAAEESLAALGFQTSQVERQFLRQAEVEGHPGGNFSDYSQPTELAVGAVFAHTAILQSKPQNYGPLFEIGRDYGRIMLLLDASQDHDQDVQAAHFNALEAAYPCQDWRQPAQEHFQQAYHRLKKGFSSLDLPNPALLQNLLFRQLGQVGRRALASCQLSDAAAGTGMAANLLATAPAGPAPDFRVYLVDRGGQSGGSSPFSQRDPESKSKDSWVRDPQPGCCPNCYNWNCSGSNCFECFCEDCCLFG